MKVQVPRMDTRLVAQHSHPVSTNLQACTSAELGKQQAPYALNQYAALIYDAVSWYPCPRMWPNASGGVIL